MSFKTFMTLKGESPKSNSLVFATREEADAYGRDLYSRWTQATGHEVRESDETINYRWDAEAYKAVPIPNPGSQAAVEQGCTCAVIDNHHGEGVPHSHGRRFVVTEGCPLHAPQAVA